MSGVTCHVSRVMCHVSHVKKKLRMWFGYWVEGMLSMGPTLSSYFVYPSQLLGDMGALTASRTN